MGRLGDVLEPVAFAALLTFTLVFAALYMATMPDEYFEISIVREGNNITVRGGVIVSLPDGVVLGTTAATGGNDTGYGILITMWDNYLVLPASSLPDGDYMVEPDGRIHEGSAKSHVLGLAAKAFVATVVVTGVATYLATRDN